jgi:uncharacterized repeat protein (TIGR01451 family)
VIDPTSPSTLYAGTYNGGVFKSADSGGMWTGASDGLYPYVSALAIDPVNTAILYAGTYYGVYRSSDAGGVWNVVDSGLGDPSIQSLAVDPVSHDTVYAGTSMGVFKSTSSGSMWSAASVGLSHRFTQALAIDPSSSSQLYCGTRGGVSRSEDAGGSWAGVNVGLTGIGIGTVAVHANAPTTIYAGGFGGVYKSINSGGAWTAANAGLTNDLVAVLAIDPTNASTVYVGMGGGGGGYLFRSTDSGNSWTRADSGLTTPFVGSLAVDPSTPATVYAATYGGGVFKSTNAGGLWVPTNTGLTNMEVNDLVVDPANPATVYAATNGGVFKSANAGGTWVAANTGLILPWPYVHCIAIDPYAPSTLYVGTDSAVFKSTNGAQSWGPAGTGITNPNVYAIVLDPTNPFTLYAATAFGRVFRSTDSGATWSAVNNGLSAHNAYALALDPTGATTLYAGTETGVWQSTPPTGIEADLSITISDTPDPVTGTTELVYTLGIWNEGPGPAGPVTVSHRLPTGVEFRRASGAGWTCRESSGVVTCTRQGLAAFAGSNINVLASPGPSAGVIVSSATISAAEFDPEPANNSAGATTTVAVPLVWIARRAKRVTADSGTFAPGDSVTYSITLRNDGAVTQTDNPGPELSDTLPTSLALVSAEATTGTVGSDTLGNTVTWDGTLAYAESVIVTIRAAVKPTTPGGTTIVNQGIVRYDANGDGTNEATAPTDDPLRPGTSDPTSFLVSTAMSYYTVTPCRLLDTRGPIGPFGGLALGASTDRILPMAGRCNIPSTARALSVNIAVTTATAPGNLRLYPAGAPLPASSSINYRAGQTRSNNAVVAVNPIGELAVRCTQASGTVHLILDVNGYFE